MTDCLGGYLVLGHSVCGGPYILGQNIRGTAFPRIKCLANKLNFREDEIFYDIGIKFKSLSSYAITPTVVALEC